MSKNPEKKRTASKKVLEASVLTAVFTAMACVLSLTAGIRLPILGLDSLKISFGGIFTFLPAIMFGPIYGGIASALCDIIGCIIKPSGAYVPWFTIVAFIGGCIKGIVWRFLTRKKDRNTTIAVRTVFICLFALILVFGCTFTASLKADGITSGVVSKTEQLPFEDEVDSKDLSFFSNVAASLARYNHDTLTLKSVTPDKNGAFTVPSAVVSGETSLALKKINASVFNTEDLRVIYIPSSCTGITAPDDFSFTNPSLTVVLEKENKAVSDFLTEYNIANHIAADGEFNASSLAVSAFAKEYSENGMIISSSDAYRKNLSGYINFMTVGFILTGTLGLVFMVVGTVVSNVAKKNDRMSLYMKTLPAVLLSGLTVTTINTFVLQQLFYAGRVFWIIYIPRLAEELLMSVIQAYIITLLLTVLSSHSMFRKLIGIRTKQKTAAASNEN